MVGKCYLFFSVVVIVNCTVEVADTGSQKVFGGSVASVGFGHLLSKNAGQSPVVFGSICAIGGQKPSPSPATFCQPDNSSVFGSTTEVVGFADLAVSGSGADDFSKKSGELLS